MDEVRRISWDEFEELINNLAEQIKASGIKPRFIYGIHRGGVIPSVMLSHRLNGVPLIDKPDTSFVLFVDDIADEGKSLTYYSSKSDCFTTATLFVRRGSGFVPDFFAEEVDKDTWVAFPWECDDNRAKDISSHNACSKKRLKEREI